MVEYVQVIVVLPDTPRPGMPHTLRLVSLLLVKMTSLNINYEIAASVFITQVTHNRQIPCSRGMQEHCHDL